MWQISVDFFDGEIDIDNEDELLRVRLGGVVGAIDPTLIFLLDETEDSLFSSTNASLFLFISSRIVFVGTGRKW